MIIKILNKKGSFKKYRYISNENNSYVDERKVNNLLEFAKRIHAFNVYYFCF